MSLLNYIIVFVIVSVQTFDMLGNLVNLLMLRLESGGHWPNAGLSAALMKLKKWVILATTSLTLFADLKVQNVAGLLNAVHYLHLYWKYEEREGLCLILCSYLIN